MSIKTRFAAFFAMLSLLLLTIAFCIVMSGVHGEARFKAEVKRSESLRLANQLSRSSNELTRMVRSFVITGEQRYEDFFYQIKGIREGNIARPVNYDEMYWDYITALHQGISDKKGDKASLISLLEQFGVTQDELSTLKLAYERSNLLAETEVEAMNAVKGKFKDASGHYTIVKSPDRKYAISLVYGNIYHQTKAKIMKPIDDFYKSIDLRTSFELDQHRNKQNNYRYFAFYLIVIAAIFSLYAIINVRKHIVNPILELSRVAERIKEGNADDRVSVKSNDEIGRLARSFNEMNDNLSDVITKLKDLSYLDSLTQIANRRTFDQNFITELSRHQRVQKSFTLMLIDVDHFKRLNDASGHQVGDQCLVEIADILSNHFNRKGDFVARYGGEEFAVILPATDAHAHPDLIEGVCRAIEAAGIPHPDSPVSQYITASIGAVSLTPDRKVSTDFIFKLADEALYQAKSAGRNRAILAEI